MVFVWVVLYGLTYTVSEGFSRGTGLAPWLTPLAMLLYMSLLLFWIFRTGQHRDIGLCAVKTLPIREYVYFLPLAVFPAYNLLTAGGSQLPFSTAVLMLGTTTAEELFFRGFLFRYFMKTGCMRSAFITSAVFALFHCVNLLQHGNIVYALMQVLCAFSVGLCYCGVVLKSGSLILCFVSHFFMNITGAAHAMPVGFGWETVWLLICAAGNIWCGIWLCKSVGKY